MIDVKTPLEQIDLYNQFRKIAEPHHMYADQIMAIAKYVNDEFIHNSKKK